MNRDETVIIKPNPSYTIVAGVDCCGKSGFVCGAHFENGRLVPDAVPTPHGLASCGGAFER